MVNEFVGLLLSPPGPASCLLSDCQRLERWIQHAQARKKDSGSRFVMEHETSNSAIFPSGHNE